MKKSVVIAFLTVIMVTFYASGQAQHPEVLAKADVDSFPTSLLSDKEYREKAAHSLADQAEAAFLKEIDEYYEETFALDLDNLEAFLFEETNKVIVYDSLFQVVFEAQTEGEQLKKHELPIGAKFLMKEGTTDYYIIF